MLSLIVFCPALTYKPIFGTKDLKLHLTFASCLPQRPPVHVPGARIATLDEVKHAIQEQKNNVCILENRPLLYMFGAINYGEMPFFINDSDGDCWDVIVPGLGGPLPYKTPFVICDILGYIEVENGNHKLAVRVKTRGMRRYSHARAVAEIQRYADRYGRFMHLDTKWHDFPWNASHYSS